MRCGPHPVDSQPGSAALGCAGLTARLAVLVALVAGLLVLAAAGLTALASLITTHGTAHARGQR